VPVTGKIYENEQENAMFRFEIYKLIDQQNEVKVKGEGDNTTKWDICVINW